MSKLPDFQSFMRPALEVLATHNGPIRARDAYDKVADKVGLSQEDREKRLPSGTQRTYRNRIGWASTYLRFAGLVEAPSHGQWQITEAGRAFLKEHQGEITVAALKQLPGFVESRKRDDDGTDEDLEAEEGAEADPATRVRYRFDRIVPRAEDRAGVLQLLAWAIENADEERADGWALLEFPRRFSLMTGGLVTCQIRAGRVGLAVMGPVSEAARTELSIDSDRDEEWKAIPGGLFVWFPAAKAARALELLRDSIDEFIDASMARSRRAADLESHSAEAVKYVASSVERELPQPEAQSSSEQDEGDEREESATSKAPVQRGRPPIFENGNRTIATLVEEIDKEGIALPDMQRPFVWEDTKVRDLLDSLFVGYPVGTLVLWRTSDEREARVFGSGNSTLRATTLVIDGQQRLTSLFAVMRSKQIVDKDGARRLIKIAFRPRDGRFDVADAAISKDPEYLANVSELWTGPRTKATIKKELLKAVKERGHEVTEEYEEAVDQNLDRAQSISSFQFPTVEIRATGQATEASEEDVADIFVRINNQGKRLGQADFVLTLLSVFHGDLRDRIEIGAKEMSEDSVVALDVQQLLRATCAVGFGRAQMSAIYSYLRGMDPSSRDADPAKRQKRLTDLESAADRCLKSTTWRDFTLRVQRAGVVHQSMVGSANAIVNAYALYVWGMKLGVEKHVLDGAISRWIFGTLLTARYSTSSETAFEKDLLGFRDLKDPVAFVGQLESMLAAVMSGDYWTRNLIPELETQRGRAPSALAFRAAQVILGAKALFSDQAMGNFLATNGRAPRASHVHHLFPKAWLAQNGFKDQRAQNQVANLADVDWSDNLAIGAQSPAKYIPRLVEKRGWTQQQWETACAEHALPVGWEQMDYDTFLRERRTRMAYLIRSAYRALGGEPDSPPITPAWFLPGAEEVWGKIAETERAVRALVRDVYTAVFGAKAAERIEGALGTSERETLARALRARPPGADPLSVVDYLYLGQLPALIFANDVWNTTRERLVGSDAKQKLQGALSNILPVRNEIAHVREVSAERLQRASLACSDVRNVIRAP